MRRARRGMVPLLAVALVAGCVPPGSLHGLYTSATDTTFDAELVGTWQGTGPRNTDTWVLRKGEDGGYTVSYTCDVAGRRDKSSWEAHLVKVGGAQFLDLLPTVSAIQSSPKVSAFYVARLHLFARVRRDKDRLHLATISPDWWEEQGKAGMRPLRAEVEADDLPVITAPTEELRAFLAKTAADPKVFREVTLVRTKPAPAPTRGTRPR